MRDFIRLSPTTSTENVLVLCQELETLLNETDLNFIPHVKSRPSIKPTLPRRIQRLLQLRSRLFAIQRASMDPEDYEEFKRVRNLFKNETRLFFQHKQSEILNRAAKEKNYL